MFRMTAGIAIIAMTTTSFSTIETATLVLYATQQQDSFGENENDNFSEAGK